MDYGADYSHSDMWRCVVIHDALSLLLTTILVDIMLLYSYNSHMNNLT